MAIKFKDANLKDFTGQVYQTDLYVKSWNLTSLEGMPKIVKGNCDVGYNKLKTLKYAPERVEGFFSCAGNNLTHLLNAPKVIHGDFNAMGNDLTSIKGFPKEVTGNATLTLNYGLKKKDVLTYLIDNNIKIGGKIIIEHGGDIKEEFLKIQKNNASSKKIGKFKDFLDI